MCVARDSGVTVGAEPGRCPGTDTRGDSMATTYSVTGMTCDHCRHAVESGVGGVPGVISVTADVATGGVRVEGDIDDAAVRAAIVDAGYEVA